MNWKETFYTGKREHPQEKKPASLTALLMPSLLGVSYSSMMIIGAMA